MITREIEQLNIYMYIKYHLFTLYVYSTTVFLWSPSKVESEILAVRASVVKFPLTCIKPFHPLFPLGITLPIQSVAGENNSI